MPICQADRWKNEECHNAHCSTFQVGYVYGLLDARVGDIFYVGSTFQRPGTRYSGHLHAKRPTNFREAWIMAILADGSLPVLFSLGEFPTECEQELKQIEHEIADALRALGYTAMCDGSRPHVQRYHGLCPLDRHWSNHLNRDSAEYTIAEYLDQVNEQARIQQWLRDQYNYVK